MCFKCVNFFFFWCVNLFFSLSFSTSFLFCCFVFNEEMNWRSHTKSFTQCVVIILIMMIMMMIANNEIEFVSESEISDSWRMIVRLKLILYICIYLDLFSLWCEMESICIITAEEVYNDMSHSCLTIQSTSTGTANWDLASRWTAIIRSSAVAWIWIWTAVTVCRTYSILIQWLAERERGAEMQMGLAAVFILIS